jgi:prepilin-type N-terminal cleavage/methylation domain-containing protein
MARNTMSGKEQKGFSLLELMIAMFIMIILLSRRISAP